MQSLRSCRSQACIQAYILSISLKHLSQNRSSTTSVATPSAHHWALGQSGVRQELLISQPIPSFVYFMFIFFQNSPLTLSQHIVSTVSLTSNSQAQHPYQSAVCTVQPLLPSWCQATSTSWSWGRFKGQRLKVKRTVWVDFEEAPLWCSTVTKRQKTDFRKCFYIGCGGFVRLAVDRKATQIRRTFKIM